MWYGWGMVVGGSVGWVIGVVRSLKWRRRMRSQVETRAQALGWILGTRTLQRQWTFFTMIFGALVGWGIDLLVDREYLLGTGVVGVTAVVGRLVWRRYLWEGRDGFFG